VVDKALFSSNKDDWETPGWLFDELDREFEFNLDPAACDENAKCDKYFTENENGLMQPWYRWKDAIACYLVRGRVFVNPPYGRDVGKWVQKAHDEVEAGNAELVVMLLPARMDVLWVHQHILPFCGPFKPLNKKEVWAAGLIDGEGCIFVRANKPTESSRHKSMQHDLGVQVHMTDQKTVYLLKEIFGCGHVRVEERNKENPTWKTAYRWTCRGNEAASVIKKIYPYLVTKKAEAYEALAFSLLPSAQHRWERVPEELIAKRAQHYETLKQLKRCKEGYIAIDTEIRFLRGRLKFGGSKNSAPFPSMVVIFRPQYSESGKWE